MPVDADGNRADIVMDGNSTINRMNTGRLYEQYINAAGRDVAKKITKDLQVNKDDRLLLKTLEGLYTSNPDLVNRSWQYLLGFYKIVSPSMYIWFTDGEYRGTILEHLASIIKNGIYLFLPPDNEPESMAMVRELEKYYPPVYGPVSYIGNSGRRVTTKEDVRIGSVYIILLEKTADDWTAVSSGKLQNFGVLSQVTISDKYSQPSRIQAVRAHGESEVRIYASYAGPKITADIMDRNNSPVSHEAILYSILRADKPTDIDIAIDRTKIPIGVSKPHQLVKHILQCSGARFVYKPYTPGWMKY